MSRPKKIVAKAEEPKRRKKNIIIGTSMPYVHPDGPQIMPTMLGYTPKKKKSRPIVQPNPV